MALGFWSNGKLKPRPLVVCLILIAPVIWAFYEFITTGDSNAKTLHVLVISTFLPSALYFLRMSEVLSEMKSQPKVSGRSYPCSNCGTLFEAVPYDDLHKIASRTKGEYKDQVPIKYKCRKCKLENVIYWSREESMPIGVSSRL